MRRFLTGVMVGMLPLYSAFADITSDMSQGLPIADVVANATAEGSSYDAILQQIAAVNPDALSSAVFALVSANPSLADQVVAAAVAINADKAAEITSAAVSAGANADSVALAAIQAGADPTAVTEATAAGNPPATPPGLTIAPGQTGIPVTPPPFGNNGGGGGGGSGSPS